MVKKEKVEIPVEEEEIAEPVAEVELEGIPAKAKYYENLFRGGK